MDGFPSSSVLLDIEFQIFQSKLVGTTNDIALRDCPQILLLIIFSEYRWIN